MKHCRLSPSAVLAAVLLLGSGAALADCPTAADLDRGVVIGFDNDDITVLTRQADGHLRVEERPVFGIPLTVRAHRGLYAIEEYSPDDDGRPQSGTLTQIEFEENPANLPTPVLGQSWEGQARVISPDGSIRNELATYRFSAGAPLVLSGCSYEVVRTDVRYDWGDQGGMTLHYAYLPTLGSAVRISSQFDGLGATPDLQPVTIERATK